MRRGRKPRPTVVRELLGNPGKRRHNRSEPQFPAADPLDCPAWLSDRAKEEWARVAPPLARLGLLTVADRAALAGYCVAYAHWLEAEEFLETNGTTFVMRDDKGVVKGRFAVPEVGIAVKMLDKIRQFAAEFGFTPSARGRIELGKVVELEGLENEELERERDRIKALLADEAPRDRKGSVH